MRTSVKDHALVFYALVFMSISARDDICFQTRTTRIGTNIDTIWFLFFVQFQIAKALILEYYEVDNSITERRGRLQLPAEERSREKTSSSFQLYHNLILIVGCLIIFIFFYDEIDKTPELRFMTTKIKKREKQKTINKQPPLLTESGPAWVY